MIPTIDFVVAGAAKSGTTSLHRYLSGHPDIFLPYAKELGFFYADEQPARRGQLANQFYRSVRRGQLVGLTEASMLMFEDVAVRICRHNANARVLIILRNPIDRAYSSYWFGRLRGWEKSPSFEVALQRELRGELESVKERIDFAHLEHGHYRQQIERYAAVMSRQNLMIILTEDLSDSPRETLAGIFEWLGVSPQVEGIRFQRRHNVTSTARFDLAARTRGMIPGSLRQYLRNNLSSEKMFRLRRVLHWLRDIDQVPFRKPPMRADTREFLRKYYAEHNADLGDLIGRDVSHWR